MALGFLNFLLIHRYPQICIYIIDDIISYVAEVLSYPGDRWIYIHLSHHIQKPRKGLLYCIVFLIYFATIKSGPSITNTGGAYVVYYWYALHRVCRSRSPISPRGRSRWFTSMFLPLLLGEVLQSTETYDGANPTKIFGNSTALTANRAVPTTGAMHLHGAVLFFE